MGWIITYKEVADGPVFHFGPVCGTAEEAHDNLIAVYTRAGFSAPCHIFMFKNTEGEDSE
jgi:hypothetical protein